MRELAHAPPLLWADGGAFQVSVQISSPHQAQPPSNRSLNSTSRYSASQLQNPPVSVQVPPTAALASVASGWPTVPDSSQTPPVAASPPPESMLYQVISHSALAQVWRVQISNALQISRFITASRPVGCLRSKGLPVLPDARSCPDAGFQAPCAMRRFLHPVFPEQR